MREYLLEKQPIIASTFINAISKDRLSHAYLLKGEPGSPLKEIAIYLAQSLVCDDPQPLACENCWNCLRIADGNYADFTLIDGAQSAIKKEAIQILEHNFDKTSIEVKGKLIYVIHLVENMTDEAVNSLLKFLEEPGKDVYAFLTTENDARVLPTIISRTQVLNVRLQPRKDVINEAMSQGIPQEDAELLSYFYNDANLIQKHLLDEQYLDTKTLLIALLEALASDANKAVFVIQNQVSPSLKSKESVRMFLDLLNDALLSAINLATNNPYVLASYDKILTPLATRLSRAEKLVIEIMKLRSEIDLNLNLSLVFDHLAYLFFKEFESL